MNFELERELLGFGSKMRVLGPRILVKQIKQQLQKALELYRQNHAPQVFPTAIPDPPSGFTDSSDASSTLYMNNIPADPITTQRYYYKSPDPSRNSGTDPTTYEIYACLEDKTDSEKTVCPGNFKDVTGAVCATSFCYKLIEP